MTPSSLREMPTVTVFAWCLMASTGRVSSSIARVRASTRSSSRAAGEPTLPVLAWYSSTGRSARDVAQQAGQVHGRARLEVAVVAVVAQPVGVLLGVAGDAARGRARARRRPTARSTTASSISSMTARSGRAEASMASAAS